ncbi:MAG: hypothetical protein HYV01_17600, partial [Deltaproteobacteria bacterium]|nr:hypothetical protein [Deltaproteobacteria bacterium]
MVPKEALKKPFSFLSTSNSQQIDKAALIKLANKSIIDEIPCLGLSCLGQLLGHEIKQSLQRRDHRVRSFGHSRQRQVVGFLGHGAVRQAAVFGLDVDRELAVGAITVHAFDVGFDEFPGDLRVPFNVIVTRGDAAEGVIQTVFGEVYQIFSTFPLGIDGFRRRDDDGIAFAVEQHLDVAAARNRFLAQAFDSC